MWVEKPKWYEDLNDYTERVSNMSEEELDTELGMLNRRIAEINLIQKQVEINRLLIEDTNVHED